MPRQLFGRQIKESRDTYEGEPHYTVLHRRNYAIDPAETNLAFQFGFARASLGLR
jgi:hypothetical protein